MQIERRFKVLHFYTGSSEFVVEALDVDTTDVIHQWRLDEMSDRVSVPRDPKKMIGQIICGVGIPGHDYWKWKIEAAYTMKTDTSEAW